jgi:hypothetical protein
MEPRSPRQATRSPHHEQHIASDPGPFAQSERAAIGSRLDIAERAGDPNAFLEALRQLPVAEQVRELGRWIPLLARRPEIEWDVWLEHARSTAALKLNVRKARIELAKWALLYEALAPLNALIPSSLTAESLAGAITQVAGAALKQRPPDGTSMAQWLDFVKAQTIPRVFAFAVEGNRTPHWDEINAAFDHVTKIAAVAIDATAGQGEEIRLVSPEPWPEPVDGVRLLDALVAAIRRFIVQSDAGTLARWPWCSMSSSPTYMTRSIWCRCSYSHLRSSGVARLAC